MNNRKIRVFLCEDDESLGVMLQGYLITKGHGIDLFTDEEMGLEAFRRKKYDLCLIDIMMPKIGDFELTKEIRTPEPEIPIIFVTAKDQKKDILANFKLGADDYITKPFSVQKLEVHMEAVMYRIIGDGHEHRQFYRLGEPLYDTKKQSLMTEGEQVFIPTTEENELLTLFCVYVGETLEREHALRTIRSDASYLNARSMNVYVTKLRKILKVNPSLEIENVHGKGYRLVTSI